MTDFKDSIAHEAHGLVHGERAKTYGHPRFDFSAIAKVWTGLCQDLLREDAVFDPYRISVLMSGLKLCRLVKSPQHRDSRVDTIGYMLTMERLDEPEDPESEEVLAKWFLRATGKPPETAPATPYTDNIEEALDTIEDGGVKGGLIEEEDAPHISEVSQPAFVFTQINVWFDPWETKFIDGKAITNDDAGGKLICFAVAPGKLVTIEKYPTPDFPKFGTPEFDTKAGQVAAEQAKDWPQAQDSHDQELPFQPPGQVQGDWVKDPTGRFWCEEGGTYHRLAGDTIPAGWAESAALETVPPQPGDDDLQSIPEKRSCLHPGTGCVGACYKGCERSCCVKPEFTRKQHEESRERLDFTHNKPQSKAKRAHAHRLQEPCIPPCPAWTVNRPQFGFSGEQVETQPTTPWDRDD